MNTKAKTEIVFKREGASFFSLGEGFAVSDIYQMDFVLWLDDAERK